ncbi:hypothetical protein OH460_08215 [Vibrio sp. Makdt]|uniref:hypothetical protein n=1 Tax=Vibrio sp. Makdt TaxID=2998828 RepID=UPI0022CDB182|nr:hypothetical protein [Vibrio sp. Makdt]MDA0152283.1 hypothetical protein [Vibrio sp. Makdt]
MHINTNNELKEVSFNPDHVFTKSNTLKFLSSEPKGQWHNKVWHPEVHTVSQEQFVYENSFVFVDDWFVVPTKVLFDQLGYSFKEDKASTSNKRHIDFIQLDLMK